MDLSIVIPIHNLENWISICLQSIIMQKIDNINVEVICVCDNCTDNSIKIVKNFAEKYKNFHFKIIEVKCGTAGKSRNEGIKYVKGKYLWLIDGDDWLIDPLAIQKIIKVFKENENINIVNFNFIMNNMIMRMNDNDGYLWGNIWSRVFEFDFIKNMWFSSINEGDDLEFFTRVLDRKPRFLDLNQVFYYYNFPRERKY